MHIIQLMSTVMCSFKSIHLSPVQDWIITTLYFYITKFHEKSLYNLSYYILQKKNLTLQNTQIISFRFPVFNCSEKTFPLKTLQMVWFKNMFGAKQVKISNISKRDWIRDNFEKKSS